MSTDIDKAVDYLYTQGQQYAIKKAHRYYMEEFRKSKKAMLMAGAKASGLAKTAADAEMMAYAHKEYTDLLLGLELAIQEEEELRWGLVAAQARIDVWRSTEASNRAMDKATL